MSKFNYAKLGIPVQKAVVTITPAIAKELLLLNITNRPINKANLKKLMVALKQKLWHLNGDPIRISSEGHLLDGQHRLQAIFNTGISCDTVVINSIPPESFITIDQGSVRSLGDILALTGEENCRRLAALVRLAMGYDALGRPEVRTTPTITEDALRYVEGHPELKLTVLFGNSHRKAGALIGPAMLDWLHYSFHRLSAEQANLFLGSLNSGENLTLGAPAYVLREKLLNNKDRYARDKVSTITRAAWTIKAWNAYRRGAPLTRINWAASKDNPQQFPTPI